MDASGESESEVQYRYRERSSQHPTSDKLPRPFQNRPPEQFHLPWIPTSPISPSTPHPPSNTEDVSRPPTRPISAVSTNTVSFKSISIKAYITEDMIVVFRAAADTTYAGIRDKVYDKFVNQEGISLRPDFPLACLAPAPPRQSITSSVYSGIARKRAGSVGSLCANESSLFSIQSQEVWEEAVRDSGGKLTLRVFE